MEKKYFFHITNVNIPCQQLSAANVETVSCREFDSGELTFGMTAS